MSNIVKATNFDLSKVTFGKHIQDNHGRRIVFINSGNEKIYVQTPKMYAPNGVKCWAKPETGGKGDKYEMELSFYGENENSELRTFHEKWREFDSIIKAALKKNCKAWLGKDKVSDEYLEDNYIPMVRPSIGKDGKEYPSRIRVKLDRDVDSQGNFTGEFVSNKGARAPVLVFDQNKEVLEFNEANAEKVIPRGSLVECLMELVYLSITKNSISVKWKFVQARVTKKRSAITTYAMLDDEAEAQEAEDLDSGNDAEAVDVDDVDVDVEVDDAEEVEVVEESEEEEVKKPAPKAKGRAKRAV